MLSIKRDGGVTHHIVESSCVTFVFLLLKF